VATVALTSFATVTLLRGGSAPDIALFNSIWPIVLTSTVAVTLVMSFLYRSLLELVQELERREVSAQHQALHDPLTGLANRALLEDRLEQALARQVRSGEDAALLILDLDGFKKINDTMGHAAGDTLVKEVGSRLLALLRTTDTVGRIGGDEFAVLLLQPKHSGNVRAICQSIIDAVGEPFSIDGRELRVGVSIGAVMATNGSSGPDLLRKADITMYRAKGAGRNCYRIFSTEMDQAVQRRDQIEVKLRQALISGIGLELHYQPQLSALGTIIGAEALLRWSDPDLGDVSPAECIPAADECGLAGELGEFVFGTACDAARACPELQIAVNLSPSQFRRKGLPQRLAAIASARGVTPERIELEITETLLIEHGPVYEQEIKDLRAMGFRIALDDFGTGYSSLSYLSRFPVDKLKLDRVFIDDAHASQNIALLRAAVGLGHMMGLEVVAEGIATAGQEQIALEAGCDGLQGHRYAPAMPLPELAAFCGRHSAGNLTAAA
jgi:diguanylate cyclase (GGDEF)-like protein